MFLFPQWKLYRGGRSNLSRRCGAGSGGGAGGGAAATTAAAAAAAAAVATRSFFVGHLAVVNVHRTVLFALLTFHRGVVGAVAVGGAVVVSSAFVVGGGGGGGGGRSGGTGRL